MPRHLTGITVIPQLPAKRRVPVPVPLTNSEEYRLAEQDVIAWLRELRVPCEYHELPGGHTWAYWDANVSSSLAFHLRHLGPAKAARARKSERSVGH